MGEKSGELRDHHGHEDDDESDAGHDKQRGIDERLLDAVAQGFDIRKMNDEPPENLGKRAANLAGGNHVHVKRGKNLRKIPHRL